MSRPSGTRWETQVREMARQVPYPPTPDIAGAVSERLAVRPRPTPHLNPAWALLLVLALLIGLLATPPVRAAILEFLQIGGVRIRLVEPTPEPTVAPATVTPPPTPISSLLDLAGETTLAEAEQKARFRVRLPTYPPDLGPPDGVFYQELGGPAVVLVWLDPQQPERVHLSLHILAEGALVEKGLPTTVATTTVNGRPAVWTTGPYLLVYRQQGGQQWDFRRLVEGHVLVWSENLLTYRLETDLSIEEAVRVAESLR
jgi:hypothetical protein